jgi:hypothetical protein
MDFSGPAGERGASWRIVALAMLTWMIQLARSARHQEVLQLPGHYLEGATGHRRSCRLTLGRQRNKDMNRPRVGNHEIRFQHLAGAALENNVERLRDRGVVCVLDYKSQCSGVGSQCIGHADLQMHRLPDTQNFAGARCDVRDADGRAAGGSLSGRRFAAAASSGGNCARKAGNHGDSKDSRSAHTRLSPFVSTWPAHSTGLPRSRLDMKPKNYEHLHSAGPVPCMPAVCSQR